MVKEKSKISTKLYKFIYVYKYWMNEQKVNSLKKKTTKSQPPKQNIIANFVGKGGNITKQIK